MLVALGFALAIAVGGGLGTLLAPEAQTPAEVSTVVVQPGESLWVIASEIADPGQDVRQVVETIRGMNGLERSTVHAGQELSVPQG
ncbi:LysM peptidoglycan-binding domain-containing protein [Sanguibacter sp. Z1732]|uniref:LysM peptidoglycan-binding domain-containing protein n=1 Tax=Sanguibacter sp. Z1732 TaxID=3435412 RepID=UPI003D9CBB3E